MPEQRRQNLRLPIECTTFIELLSSRSDHSEPGRTLTCKTLNMSRAGLQVILAEKLLVADILKIGVDLPTATDTLYLAGEVRWCLPSHDEQLPWMAGFLLLNSSDTDIDQWIALLAAMEN